MIRLLQCLIFGHIHKWKILDNHPIYDNPNAERPIAVLYDLQCEKCGDLKFKRSYY